MAKAACDGKLVDAEARYNYDAVYPYVHGLSHTDFGHVFLNINTDRSENL